MTCRNRINPTAPMFTDVSAARIRMDGLAEESRTVPAPLPASGAIPVLFTPSALGDWQFLAAAHIPGREFQYHELLALGLATLRLGPPDNGLTVLETDCYVWSQQNLRWSIRSSGDWSQIFVHGISRAEFDPYRRLWRYYSQYKAVDLLESSKLYFCRLDLLRGDPSEGRPPESMVALRDEITRRHFGAHRPDPRRHYDNERRATYTCCWQKLENESADMWREYCDDGAGLVIQSTERRLQHQFAAMQTICRLLYFREVAYIDHSTHEPQSHGFPEQAFLKERRFQDERETRFVWYMVDALCGTAAEIEQSLSMLPPGQQVPFDLLAACETLVINPEASDSDQQELLTFIDRWQPGLRTRIRTSSIPR